MAKPSVLCWVLPFIALTQQVAAQTATQPDTGAYTPNAGSNGGTDNPQDPGDAGAAGASKGAFNLSNGGVIAIAVVAVLVVALGIGSAVLFWLAKKRQWDVRQSIRRASRRMTGRSAADIPSKRQNRRTGVRLDDPPAPKRKIGQQEKDIERGVAESGRAGKTTTTITSHFDVDTPTPKGWTASKLSVKK